MKSCVDGLQIVAICNRCQDGGELMENVEMVHSCWHLD